MAFVSLEGFGAANVSVTDFCNADCGSRYVDNGNGTVTDTLTDLVWLRNASCFSYTNWDQATADAASLADGQCSLTDGSPAGD